MAGLKIKWAGTTKTPTAVTLKWGGNRTPTAVRVKSGGVWVKVWPLTVTASVTGDISGQYGNGTFTHGMSVSVSGGVGPFTYSWALTGAVRCALLDPTNTSGVTVRSTATNQEAFGTLTVTITDTGNGNAVTTASAYLNYQHGTPI